MIMSRRITSQKKKRRKVPNEGKRGSRGKNASLEQHIFSEPDDLQKSRMNEKKTILLKNIFSCLFSDS